MGENRDASQLDGWNFLLPSLPLSLFLSPVIIFHQRIAPQLHEIRSVIHWEVGGATPPSRGGELKCVWLVIRYSADINNAKLFNRFLSGSG